MKINSLLGFAFCFVTCLIFTSCNKDVDVLSTAEVVTYDHAELAKKMYSADFLEGKGEVIDGELIINQDLTQALSKDEIAFLEKEGALYIDKSFTISYEDAKRIWGEDAPIPEEGISFDSGTYTPGSSATNEAAERGCWVCQQCSCGVVVCTYYSICIIIIVL